MTLVRPVPEAMLQIRDLTYHYPDTERAALRHLSLSLDAGEILLVAGSTGSGKSTLCYALSGFIPHYFSGRLEGEIRMNGRDVREASLGEWVRNVGLVLQNPFNQISGARMTVSEEVAFGLENLGVPRDEMAERVSEVLQLLEISDLAGRSPYELSGGQMQRVAIASILVLRPQLLVLDEPTAQLDPDGTREVFDVLRVLAREGATVVLATHKLAAAASIASRALLLDRGSIATEGDVRSVLTDPRLREWGVEPPVYVTLAEDLGIPAPYPLTFEEALQAFSVASALSPEVRATRIKREAIPAPAPATSDLRVKEGMVVVAEGLRFTYPSGVEALRGASMRLEPGQIATLIGANGAGKSTLSRSLNGLLRPQEGSIRIGEWNVSEHRTSELAARIGYAFQNPDDQLFKSTVAEEVAFGPRNLGMPEDEVEAAVTLALELTGLTELREFHPYDLHAEQRRWVALASILALRAPVLVLDEPTTGMDSRSKQRMAGLLSRLRDAGYTLLVISHDMHFVGEIADRLYVMAEGRIIAGGPPGEVFEGTESLELADVEPPPVVKLARALGLGGRVVRAAQFVEAWRARHG